MLGNNSNYNNVDNDTVNVVERVLLSLSLSILVSLLLPLLLQDNSEPKEYSYYDSYQYGDSIFYLLEMTAEVEPKCCSFSFAVARPGTRPE